jgi:hypothetical protein
MKFVSILFIFIGQVFEKSFIFNNHISILFPICRVLDDIMLDVFQSGFISNQMIIKPRLPFEIRIVVFPDETGDCRFV